MLISFFLPLYLSIFCLLVWEILPMISSLRGAWEYLGLVEMVGIEVLAITKITSLDKEWRGKKAYWRIKGTFQENVFLGNSSIQSENGVQRKYPSEVGSLCKPDGFAEGCSVLEKDVYPRNLSVNDWWNTTFPQEFPNRGNTEPGHLGYFYALSSDHAF